MLLTALTGCTTERREPAPSPTYADDVGQVLRAKCAGCHAGPAPAAGWSAERYIDVVGCIESGAAATLSGDGGAPAPLVAALDRPDHASLLSADEGALVRTWVANGAPAIRGGIHTAGFVDPRSPENHGRALRAKGYRPMTDREDRDACGRCHGGLGTTGPTLAAPGATPCTTCHSDEGGAFACTTCHGAPAARGKAGHAHPPRDPCFHPEARPDTTHASHVDPSGSRAQGLACTTCHPTPTPGVLAAPHADGYVSVWFDPKLGTSPAFDAATKTCTGTCHARGGTRPTPAWTDGATPGGAGCSSCHASPPPAHYQGACASCHREANATGTALATPVLHVNGKVDLGDGSGACGACHGRGADPWPDTGAHRAHASPRGSKPVACETCHEVPQPGAKHPVGKGGPTIRLAGLATIGARRASYDPATKSCAGTYCHEYIGGSLQTPTWTAGPSQAACGTCHSAPPPLPHIQDVNCSAAGCHENLTATNGRSITALGAPGHVDGVVDRKAK